MGDVRTSYWEQVVADGCRVPTEEPLDDLTTELVAMLGDTDPHVRDELAYSVLSRWVAEGVYDHLLAGLGDGLAGGLRYRLGESGTTSVLRRSYSAVVLAAVVARDNAINGVHPVHVLTWADQTISWLLAERDLRGWVPDLGWVHGVAHGADLIGTLSASRHLGADELGVLLDVLADRLLMPTDQPFTHGEDDRLAFATMSILHRDLMSAEVIERWLARLVSGCAQLGDRPEQPASAVRHNVVGYLRALHLQLLLGVTGTPTQDAADEPRPAPAVRSDALLALQSALRKIVPGLFRPVG